MSRGQSKTKRVIDRALSALRDWQPLVGPGEAGKDRKPRRVGGRIAQRAEVVGVHVPDGFLRGVPLSIRVFTRAAGDVQLVGGVAVLVPNDEVRVVAIRIRAVLVIALNDRVCRNRHRHDVALAGIVVNYHVHFRRGLAVNDVVRNTVKGLAPLAGLSSPQSGWNGSEVPICEMTAAELAATGTLLISWFQG